MNLDMLNPKMFLPVHCFVGRDLGRCYMYFLLHRQSDIRLIYLTEIYPMDIAKYIATCRNEHERFFIFTYNPYIVGHFEPEEVSLLKWVGKDEVEVIRFHEHPVVKQERSVFNSGEIWGSGGLE